LDDPVHVDEPTGHDLIPIDLLNEAYDGNNDRIKRRHRPNGLSWRAWLGWDRLTLRAAPSLLMMSNDKSWLKFVDALNAARPSHPFIATRPNRLAAHSPFSDRANGYYERPE